MASTSPIFSACRGNTVFPVVIISNAAGTPTNRGRRCVPPKPGRMPSLTSGRPNMVLAWALAIRAWQANASSSPPPRQAPSTATTNGFGERPISSKTVWAVLTNCSNASKGPLLLCAMHLLQIGSGTEVSFLQAHEHHTGDRSRLLCQPDDIPPFSEALTIEDIDRFPAIIKPCQENSILDTSGLEVFEVGRHRYFLSTIIATPCPPPTHMLIRARSASRRLSSKREVIARRRPDTPTG